MCFFNVLSSGMAGPVGIHLDDLVRRVNGQGSPWKITFNGLKCRVRKSASSTMDVTGASTFASIWG